MSDPTPAYILNKDIYYHTGFHNISFWLHAGERCEYFAHSDTYIFEARSGIAPFVRRADVEARLELFNPCPEPNPKRGKSYGMRMAKPTQENFETLLHFLQTLEEKVDNLEDPCDIGEWITNNFRPVEACYQRVLWAYKTLEDNAADPDLDYLDWKPEIKAALEQAGFEVYPK